MVELGGGVLHKLQKKRRNFEIQEGDALLWLRLCQIVNTGALLQKVQASSFKNSPVPCLTYLACPSLFWKKILATLLNEYNSVKTLRKYLKIPFTVQKKPLKLVKFLLLSLLEKCDRSLYYLRHSQNRTLIIHTKYERGLCINGWPHYSRKTVGALKISFLEQFVNFVDTFSLKLTKNP